MNPFIWKKRFLSPFLPSPERRRLVLITGPRQTGKTSLVRRLYAQLNYINFDLAENRDKVRRLSLEGWQKTIGVAVIDEVQKEPEVLEKIKYLYDAGNIDFMVLLGSSQILLLKRIRESLAGRVSIYELFPLMMSEIASTEDKELKPPLFDKLLLCEKIEDILDEEREVLFDEQDSYGREFQDYLLRWGGMPALINLPESEREKWLKDYEYTYLERDLADLARLNDLLPFRNLQKIAALRSAGLLNYSDLARDAGISIERTRRYLEYLKISYQVFFLPPYYENLTKRLVKSAKLYWMDIGILRQLMGYRGATNGVLYETMVVSEMAKWIRSNERKASLYYYRTHHGAEVDLLIETRSGIIGVEIKSREDVFSKDIRNLQDIAERLGCRWAGGLVVYNGSRLFKMIDSNIWAIPSYRLFV